MSDYRKLTLWQEAMNLVEGVYRITQGFPPEERFGLVIQMRRAAVSIASNIAEGASRGNKREFLQFLRIAKGSHAELETQIEIARRLGFLNDELSQGIERVGKILGGLLKSLVSRNP
ncbi:MAG: four helix bundle protein [candidate division WOR-3 bacterium]